jgi:hypothetical protein
LRSPEQHGWVRPDQAVWAGEAHGGQVRAQEGLDREIPPHLIASNGQVIASSESYESKASTLNGIESGKRNAADAEVDNQPDTERTHGSVYGQRLASNLPETTPCNATRSTTRPRVGWVVDLD